MISNRRPTSQNSRELLSLPKILADIESHANEIVAGIGRESLDVYSFLCDQFARGPVDTNSVFQFVYRSFYRLDNAGLTDNFKTKYFSLMEKSRNLTDPNLREIAKELHPIANRQGRESLQFSFVTKLANTINNEYPIYDSKVAEALCFHPQVNKNWQVRLDDYMKFYELLRASYKKILVDDLLKEPRRIFREIYSGTCEKIPPVKVLDFIFWSHGKLKSSFQEDPAFTDKGVTSALN